MASNADTKDLDSILDDALEAFDTPVDKPSNKPSVHTGAVDEAEDAPDVPSRTGTGGTQTREEVAPQAGDDETSRALEDALRALGELGAPADGEQPSGADVSESDMKLVEEFVTTLGESLSGLGATDFLSGLGGSQTAGRPDGGRADGKTEPPVVEKLVESIVGHLLSEDVLKGPMLQMRSAYASWMPANEKQLSPQDRQRFARQQELVEQICQKYEQGVAVTEIMELLTFMQETGAPPDEVMNQLSTTGALDGIMDRLGGLDVNN